MRTALSLVAIASILSLVCPSSAAEPAARDASAFDFATYGALKTEKGNLFFSGPSMREALGIAYLGARGSTASEMSKALRLDVDPSKSADDAKTEIADFNAAKGSASFAIANRLWVDTSYQPKAPFTQLAVKGYGASLDPLDFRNAPDPSRVTINDWVAKQTNDKIKDLLPPSSIKGRTRMVITNAIYFRGNWEHAFDGGSTKDADFFVDGTSATKAPMMHQTSSYGTANIDGATMLEMKYEKSDLAMDVLLPDSKTGLTAIEDKVVANGIGAWTTGLHSSRVAVSFPKFTVSWTKSMKETLSRMGMPAAFDDTRADFTGIADPATTDGPLLISDVFHKAFVAVDEKGTEASAATGVVIANPSAVQLTSSFVADHPFLFVIRDTKHNRILFTGRVTNPKA
jgi:serpin B